MIVHMVRLLLGLAAWMAGTVIAVCVALLGANVVIRNAGVEPGMPVLNAAVLTPSVTSSPSATPISTTPTSATQPAAIPHAGNADRPPRAKTTTDAGETSPAQPLPSATYQSATPTGQAPSASASASASASDGDVRAYAMVGGNVTLQVTATSVQLITAVPDASYSVQTWSGTDWLRVDFSSGTQVSSLIASWYEHAPTITVTN